MNLESCALQLDIIRPSFHEALSSALGGAGKLAVSEYTIFGNSINVDSVIHFPARANPLRSMTSIIPRL